MISGRKYRPDDRPESDQEEKWEKQKRPEEERRDGRNRRDGKKRGEIVSGKECTNISCPASHPSNSTED